jgi:HAD superfamily phosphatase (TIGR01668 family)
MDRFSRFFVPNLICESVFKLPKKYVSGKKIRAIIFDIDNTLVAYDEESPDEKTVAFLKSLEEKGIRIVLVSNNSAERVAKFNEKLGFFCVPDAGKPRKTALKPALEYLEGIKRKRILFVGDQLLTDVLAAKRNRLRAVVAKPIKKKENLFFRLKRRLEQPFIRKYHKIKARKQERKLQRMQKKQQKKGE